VDVQYTQELVGNRKVKAVKPAPLTEEMLAKVAAEAYDLSDSFRVLKYDEIKRLVDSGGDPDEVDHVFSSPDAGEGEPDAEPEAGAVASTPKANALTKPKPVEKAAESADIEAQVRAEIAARMAARTSSTVKKTDEPQSDEDFIKQYALKQ
jgi:hypothetical protein